jgi:FkbM family methyltransferase
MRFGMTINSLIVRLRRGYEKNRNELLGIALRRYPAFVRSNIVPEEIPVFQFHHVTRELLEPLLQYLHENEYQTLTADEYFEHRRRGRNGRERKVLLTFDDGRSSLYSSAFPILRAYGQTAVAYIVPGRVPESQVESNGPESLDSLCSWQHIREMHESGLIDIQSHSMYHHSVAISPRVLDFFRPGLSTSFLDSDLSPLHDRIAGTGQLGPDAWGLPVHACGALLGGSPAYVEDPRVADLCREYVRAHGGAEFFMKRTWRSQLFETLRAARERYGVGRLQDERDHRRAVLDDLRESRAEIERRLPGKAARHFCLPWFRGSPLAVELSGQAGFVSNAWGSLLPSFLDQHSLTPLPIQRLLPHYIWRLPGEGRRPVTRLGWRRSPAPSAAVAKPSSGTIGLRALFEKSFTSIRRSKLHRIKSLTRIYRESIVYLHGSNRARVGEFEVAFDPCDRFIASKLIVDHGYEKKEIDRLCSFIRTGDVVVDVGANIGLYTLPMSRAVGASGKVISFEPDPRNAEILRSNIAHNRCTNVIVMPCALGDQNKEMDLYQVEENRGHLSFADLGHTGRSVKVPMRRGEEVFLELGVDRPNLIKIDVEGAEPLVISGLGTRSRYLQFEFVPQQMRALELDPAAMLDELISCGYELSLIDRDTGDLESVSPEVLLERAEDTGLDYNVMAVLR